LHKWFPKLQVGNSTITSPANPRYNCVAWAAGTDEVWWEYDPERLAGVKTHWPRELSEGNTLSSWVKLFEIEGGWRPTDNARYERGFEKLAIYADKAGSPTHVARLVGPRKWTSKLGRGVDIEHDTLDLLAGDAKHEYGSVVRFLVRRKK
jgi:hypothetical protein